MRLCFLCNEYPPGPHGGIGTMTQVSARKLAAAGHEVRVVGIGTHPGGSPAYESDGGIEVVRLPRSVQRFGWVRERFELYRLVSQWARAGEIDLVESPDFEGWIAGWPRLPVPVVVRLQGSGTYFAQEMGVAVSTATRRLEGAALHRADRLCSVSRYTARRTERLFRLPRVSCVLHNAVEALVSPPPLASRERNLVVFSGTLVEKKGIVQLLEAWPAVRRECRGAELFVFGKDGRSTGTTSMRDWLIARLPHEHRGSVCFRGHAPRAQLLTHLERARVAVFPSFAEAFAMAPLEAMAHGSPTIHTLRGSGPEMIANEVEGLLVDPGRPADIADAIVRVLQDDELAHRLGQAGWRHVRDNFSDAVLTPRNEAFYRDCWMAFQADDGHAGDLHAA